MRRTTENRNSGEPGGELVSASAGVTISTDGRDGPAVQMPNETTFNVPGFERVNVSPVAVTTGKLHGLAGVSERFSLWQGGTFAASVFSMPQ
jgi:hypothetical protein